MRNIWIIFVLTCLTATAAGAGGVYKWTDADGKVHYGSAPPPGQAAQVVNVQSDSGTNARARADSQPVEATESRAKPTAYSDAEEHCSVARHNLEILENTAIRQFRDSEGKTVSYSPEERAQLIEETRAQISYFCQD